MSARTINIPGSRVLILPVTLLFAAACWAQSTTAIEGVVNGLDGKPMKGAQIQIERKDIKGNYKVKSDKKGHYFYGGLPKGTYKVSVMLNGQEAQAQDNVPTNYSNPVDVNFDLSKSQAAADAKDAERGMSTGEKADYEKKLKDKTAAIAKNKALNDAFSAGVQAQDAKQWDAAIQSFEKAATIDATQHVIFGRLGDCYVALAQTKTGADQTAALGKADEAYQKAIALKPDAPEYHNNYALALAKEKKFNDAQGELTKAAQLDPASAGKYYFNMGAVLVNTGQTEPAVEAFKKTIEVDPNYADAYYQLGLLQMGKVTVGADGKMTAPPGTAEQFQKYLQLSPNGKDAETAKAMLQQIGASAETGYKKK